MTSANVAAEAESRRIEGVEIELLELTGKVRLLEEKLKILTRDNSVLMSEYWKRREGLRG